MKGVRNLGVGTPHPRGGGGGGIGEWGPRLCSSSCFGPACSPGRSLQNQGGPRAEAWSTHALVTQGHCYAQC